MIDRLCYQLFDRIGVLENDLKSTKQTYSSVFTKLILMVKKLEAQIKIGKARRRDRIVYSDDEDIVDDSSKQGRILSDAEVQEKASNETEPVILERSSEKSSRQDTGTKAIMIESEPKKKSKKELEQERLSFAEAIRLKENIANICEKVWDFNQNIEPIEHGPEKMKSPEKIKSPEKSPKKIEEEDVVTQEEMKEVVKEPGAK
ncbi:hypothetical protein Tco_0073377 [Tanacetum coccineum]